MNKRIGDLSGRVLVAALAACCLASACAARDTGESRSHVEHAGLAVDFTPKCSAGEVRLYSTIKNLTNLPITIQSGSWPWQSDILGSDFVAETAGIKLDRSQTRPMLGRTGPLILQPHAQNGGMVVISSLFPTLRAALVKGPVIIRWKYQAGTESSAANSDVFEGALTLNKDPCS